MPAYKHRDTNLSHRPSNICIQAAQDQVSIHRSRNHRNDYLAIFQATSVCRHRNATSISIIAPAVNLHHTTFKRGQVSNTPVTCVQLLVTSQGLLKRRTLSSNSSWLYGFSGIFLLKKGEMRWILLRIFWMSCVEELNGQGRWTIRCQFFFQPIYEDRCFLSIWKHANTYRGIFKAGFGKHRFWVDFLQEPLINSKKPCKLIFTQRKTPFNIQCAEPEEINHAYKWDIYSFYRHRGFIFRLDAVVHIAFFALWLWIYSTRTDLSLLKR